MVSDLTPPISALFVPGSCPDRFAKAAGSGADAIILALEDAVAAPAKVTARQCVVAWKGVPACRTFVRINGRRSPWFADDLSGLDRHRPTQSSCRRPKAPMTSPPRPKRSGAQFLSWP
jgi:citrate lyase subunit beta/citryl-CoA lyase